MEGRLAPSRALIRQAQHDQLAARATICFPSDTHRVAPGSHSSITEAGRAITDGSRWCRPSRDARGAACWDRVVSHGAEATPSSWRRAAEQAPGLWERGGPCAARNSRRIPSPTLGVTIHVGLPSLVEQRHDGRRTPYDRVGDIRPVRVAPLSRAAPAVSRELSVGVLSPHALPVDAAGLGDATGLGVDVAIGLGGLVLDLQPANTRTLVMAPPASVLRTLRRRITSPPGTRAR